MKGIIEVQQDDDSGELYLKFPEQLLNQMGWSEGDILEWFDNGNNSWEIKKSKVSGCECSSIYELVPNDEGYDLFSGRCKHHHGYKLAKLSDVAFNFEPRHIEKILNLGSNKYWDEYPKHGGGYEAE